MKDRASLFFQTQEKGQASRFCYLLEFGIIPLKRKKEETRNVLDVDREGNNYRNEVDRVRPCRSLQVAITIWPMCWSRSRCSPLLDKRTPLAFSTLCVLSVHWFTSSPCQSTLLRASSERRADSLRLEVESFSCW